MRLMTRPLLAGLAVGAVACAAIVLLPSTAIESIVSRTRIDHVLDAAKPPLGIKARFILGLFPFFLMTAIGLAVGLVLGSRKRVDDDFGVYPDYNLGAPPTADPFADSPYLPPAAADPFAAPEPAYAAPAAAEPPPIPGYDPAPAEPAHQPPPAYAPPAPSAGAATQPVDVVTAADVSEIADAVVRLGARLDAIEAKLDQAPRGAVPADLAERLARIARALDDAG